MCLTRLLSFIDRSNIGNAKIDGLASDLHIETGTGFNIALLVFYVPYILVDVPSNWIIKRVRAGIYLPTLITAWGLVCTMTGFVTSLGGLIACRIMLGLCEGGILGGVIVYLAMFYPRHQMLFRCGLFYSAAPLSGAFGGLIASALGRIKYHGYNKWPWIFFGEFGSGSTHPCFPSSAFRVADFPSQWRVPSPSFLVWSVFFSCPAPPWKPNFSPTTNETTRCGG